MESRYKLKHAESKLKKVIIVHDMTELKRQQHQRLVDEAKLRTEEDSSGKFHVKVWGMPGHMRIVKLKVRN